MKKVVQEIHKWLKNPGNERLYQSWRDQTEKLLAQPELTQREFVTIGSKLSAQSNWFKNQFLSHLFEGSPALVPNGAAFLDCSFLHLRILTAIFDQSGEGGRSLYPQPYRLFALLVACGRREQAEWLGERIYRSRTDRAFGEGEDGGGWKDRPFAGFVLRLWSIMSSGGLPADGLVEFPPAGPYQEIFDCWEDPSGLGEAIGTACDYHIRRSREEGDSRFDVTEFSFRPYDVLPIEALALRRVRSWLGLETPFPSIELLESPLVKNLPEVIPASDDLLIRKAYQRAQVFFGQEV